MKKKTIADKIIDAVFFPSSYMPHKLSKHLCEFCGEGWVFRDVEYCADCLEREAYYSSMEEDALSERDAYRLAH